MAKLPEPPQATAKRFYSNYPGAAFDKYIQATISNNSELVEDWIHSLMKLPEFGDLQVLHNNIVIPEDFYTPQILPGEKSATHFQGIIRIPKTNYFIISGADVKNNVAQLFIGQIGSYISDVDEVLKDKITEGPIGSNMIFGKFPPVTDHLVDVFKFEDEGFYHAGGMDLEGDILVVPLESHDKESKVKFVNVSDPKNPKVLPEHVDIFRTRSVGKGGASSLVQLASGNYLCGMWSDSDHLEPRLDLYLSKSSNLMDGFKVDEEYITTSIFWNEINRHEPNVTPFQTLQFFRSIENKIFALAASHTNQTTPVIPIGENKGHILQIELDLTLDGQQLLDSTKIHRIQTKSFSRVRYPFNFRAGTGFSINHLNEISLYAVAHWRTGDRSTISIGEFYRPLTNKEEIVDHIDHAILELYEKPLFGLEKIEDNFEQTGRSIKLYGKRYIQIADFSEIHIQGEDGLKHCRSLRGKLPNNWKVEFFGRSGFQELLFSKEGTGRYFEIPDINKLGNSVHKIRSLKYSQIS